ncbi:hypothetical protein FKW77_007035 [Venturia effusa]|uniref:DUF7605 domain-containing protein n=1 Tax=Venturia effusa TaxID=50376 RepID=A0A517L5S3_9PEZI|nr:hypothetical protein FKW77_007035 [Venturia effusa]
MALAGRNVEHLPTVAGDQTQIKTDSELVDISQSQPKKIDQDGDTDMQDDSEEAFESDYGYQYEYDVLTELRLSSVVSTRELESGAVERGKKTICELEVLAKKTRTGDSGFSDSLRQAMSFKLPTKRFGFVGDIGQGKSSTINSLLNCEGVAPTGDSGSAETQLPMEFCQKQDDQDATFSAEAVPYSLTEMKEICKESLADFRRPLFMDFTEEAEKDFVIDDDSDGDYELPDQEESAFSRAEVMESAELAWTRLSALFMDQEIFDASFLRDFCDGAEDAILLQFESWLEQLNWPTSAEWTETAESTTQIHKAIDQWTEHKFRPFIKVVRIYFDNPLLRYGIILVDLPGVQDINRSRAKIAEAYIHRCQIVFIVANIGHILDNLLVKHNLDTMMSGNVLAEPGTPGKYIRTAVICTRSHTIDISSGRRSMLKYGEEEEIDELNAIDRKIAELDTFILKGRSTGKARNFVRRTPRSLQEQVSMSPKHKEAYGEIQKLNKKRKRDLIAYRAKRVRKEMQQIYCSNGYDRDFEVFCIDNKTYTTAATESNREEVAWSGVRTLRLFCYNTAAECRSFAAQGFMTNDIPKLISSFKLQIWQEGPSSSEKMHDSSNLKKIVDDALSKLERFSADANGIQIPIVQEPISQKAGKAMRLWTQHGQKLVQTWGTWHCQTFKSSCLHDGHHKTKKQGAFDWNRDLASKMTKDLQAPWDEVIGKSVDSTEPCLLAEELHRTYGKIQRLLEEVQRNAKDKKLPSDFQRSIDLAPGMVKGSFECLKEGVFKKLWEVRRHSTGTAATSHLLDAMTPTYRQAAQQTGKGMAVVQRGIISGTVDPGTPYKTALERIQEEFKNAVEDFFQKLFAKAAQELNSITAILVKLESLPIEVDQARLTVLEHAHEQVCLLERLYEKAVKSTEVVAMQPEAMVVD